MSLKNDLKIPAGGEETTSAVPQKQENHLLQNVHEGSIRTSAAEELRETRERDGTG